MFLSTICRKVKYENVNFRRLEIWLSKCTANKKNFNDKVMNNQSLLTILKRDSTTLLTVAECGTISLLTVAEFCKFTLLTEAECSSTNILEVILCYSITLLTVAE